MVIARSPLRKRLNNLYWEYRLGISTRGIIEIDHPDAHHYATMLYSTIQQVITFLALNPSDVFIDIGSGKGRVLCCAARLKVRKVIGVDLSEDLCRHARKNVAHMRERKSTVEVHCGIAENFDYSNGTVFTLFNPFGAVTLDNVLRKIAADLGPNKSRIRIAYANPEHDNVFRSHPWLERYEYWDRKTLRMEHSVSFYKARL